MSLGEEVLFHRKLCADEGEVGPCFYCRAFIHKGEKYVMIISRPGTDESLATGVCADCGKKIGRMAARGR